MARGTSPSTTRPKIPWLTPRVARVILILLAAYALSVFAFWVSGQFSPVHGKLVHCESSRPGVCQQYLQQYGH